MGYSELRLASSFILLDRIVFPKSATDLIRKRYA
jgi:hypothetical protein